MVTGSITGKPSRLAGLAVVLLAGTALCPDAARAECEDLVPPLVPVQGFGSKAAVQGNHAGPRTVTAGDLLRLRDLGPADGSVTDKPTPFGVSPDGAQAAFVLSRADPATNRYCRALVVLPLTLSAGASREGGTDDRAKLRVIDSGGDYISDAIAIYGKRIENGFTAVVTPRWSPDGRSIAYLRRDADRDGGKVQIWIARADGNGASQVTHSSADIEAVAWSADGSRLIYRGRAATAQAEQALTQESRSGWLYDVRYMPAMRAAPFVPLQPLETLSVALDGGGARAAVPTEVERIDRLEASDIAMTARASDGHIASISHPPGNPYAPTELTITSEASDPTGARAVKCADAVCKGGFGGVWWLPEGQGLLFLRREGWDKGTAALYRWSGEQGASPVRLWKSDDVLLGCTATGAKLLCTRENAVTPRRVAMVDMETGKVRDLYDPNPEFGGIVLGKVERLYWRNNLGLEARGDLVLPPGYRKGKRLPLVVVQYESNGFLRGGTGDEYPIHALAAAGIAVLSIQRPPPVSSLHPEVTSSAAMLTVLTKDWAERRSMQSAIEMGVKAAVDLGIADRDRLGITGLSDGASATRFALINSDLFKVASISTCCVDENALTYNGLAVQKQFEAMGYPPPGGVDKAFWKPYSIALNAPLMTRPLLMQLSDDEYLGGLNAFAALKSAGQPVEMFVFAGEHHRKWQPAHRGAVYQRNLDWFRFWFLDLEDRDPGKRAQYARWEVMRDRLRPRP